jgi:16S rRNA processing protein RimM
VLARVARTRGVHGEVLADAFGQPADRFAHLGLVTLFQDGRVVGQFAVQSATPYRGRWILKFDGINDIDAAAALRGCDICVPMAERPPADPGSYYLSDLLGCRLIDRRTGEELGAVEAWQDYGPVPVLVAGPLEIPFARSICVEIDLAARRILVNLPAGLKELNAL